MSVTSFTGFKIEKDLKVKDEISAKLVECYDEILAEEFSLYFWAIREAHLHHKLIPPMRRIIIQIDDDLDKEKTLIHDTVFSPCPKEGDTSVPVLVKTSSLIATGPTEGELNRADVGYPQDVKEFLALEAGIAGVACIQQIIRSLDATCRFGSVRRGPFLFIEASSISNPSDVITMAVDLGENEKAYFEFGLLIPVEA